MPEISFPIFVLGIVFSLVIGFVLAYIIRGSRVSKTEKELAVKEAINDWKSNLIKDTFNNFLTISVKYVWPHW